MPDLGGDKARAIRTDLGGGGGGGRGFKFNANEAAVVVKLPDGGALSMVGKSPREDSWTRAAEEGGGGTAGGPLLLVVPGGGGGRGGLLPLERILLAASTHSVALTTSNSNTNTNSGSRNETLALNSRGNDWTVCLTDSFLGQSRSMPIVVGQRSHISEREERATISRAGMQHEIFVRSKGSSNFLCKVKEVVQSIPVLRRSESRQRPSVRLS